MTSAVLVIDVQQALCSGRYAAFDASGLLDRINRVSAKARAAGAAVIFVQHEADDGLFDHGSDGWQLAAGLHVLDGDLRLRKTASDAFHRTELQALLQRLAVDQLVVCGIQSDFCVDSTTRRALALGYPVTLVADGHSTLDNGLLTAAQIIRHHTVTLSNIDSYAPAVVTPVAVDALRFDAPANRSTADAA